MGKPKIFIGSSSEGLKIAEAVFAHFNYEAVPTLWTQNIFLPGQYPLEALEKELKRHHFAIIVASPDDEIIKRGISSPSMRDNLMLEFGLFAGALGRRRAFFICPNEPKIELPTDLMGLISATYDSRRTGSASEISAGTQVACQRIREVIKDEWGKIESTEREITNSIRQSEKGRSVQKLYMVASRLQDILMVVQKDAFAAFTDKPAFESIKAKTADEITNIAESFSEDASKVGALKELMLLADATRHALSELPFPQELGLGKEASKRKAINIGIGALDSFLKGGDPMRHVKDSTSTEVSGRLKSLGLRYSDWWAKHSIKLQEGTKNLQDLLFSVLIEVSKYQIRPQ